MASWKPLIIEIADAARHWVEPFVPGAVGAAIAQMWPDDHPRSWRDRLAQWTVGVTFAAFLVPAAGHVFGWPVPLINAVGFVVGTLAFKAYKPLREAFIVGAAGGLKAAFTNLGSWVPRRGSTPVPPNTEGEG